MQFDPVITKSIQDFINADDDKRDYENAAMLLLKVSGNRVEYKNNIANLNNKKAHILSRLRMYLEFRLKAMTKEEVAQMKAKADEIVKNIDKNEERIKFGKRDDHDSLPDEVIAAYKDANICIQKQKQLHLKMRNLALAEATCPDSELYPFVKEMIELDKRRLADWKLYDEFNPASK